MDHRCLSRGSAPPTPSEGVGKCGKTRLLRKECEVIFVTIAISRLLRTLLSPPSRNNRRQQCRSQDKQPQITGQRIVCRQQVPNPKTADQSCNHLENHCQNSPAYSSQPAITGSTLLHYAWQQQPGNQENARTQHNPADRQCPFLTDCPDQYIFPQSTVQDCHRDKAKPHYERFQYIAHCHSFIHFSKCLFW